ncbi:PKD domain-containing protein [Candidatus Microgenomates bacterium]|nr:MAG: PKD domain-containing protein [Candidatus Microgenomates bacterium]
MKKVILIVLFMFLGITLPKSAIAAPPVNFQKQQLIGTGLEGPSGFEIAPDGRIFILERTGTVKIFKDGALLSTPFATLPSAATGDRGLIGIAFDPNFSVTPYVYFYYTGEDLLNYLVRFDATGDVGTNGPVTLYQTFSPSFELHVGGSVRFGPDGKIYLAVGDNGYPPNAQNLSNPHGKILRINKDGTIPADNPFVFVEGALPEIWAYGFRNPWRFQFDPADGRLYGGDVGDFSVEEVNHIVAGGNYGWPFAEGACSCGYIDPMYAYTHDGLSSAVTGGPVYRATQFPSEYVGNLFVGDYARGFIRNLDFEVHADGTVHVHSASEFDPVAGSVVDLKVGPDGSLYYITYIPGRLYQVTYSTGNQFPVAVASSDVTKGTEPLTVNFSSSGTYDPDGDALTYLWDFGDGTTSSEANPTKEYTQVGAYTVDLTVADEIGNESQANPIVIQVGLPPVVTIGSPTDGDTYRAGDTIFYAASAVDGAGFDLHDEDFTTEIILHHDTHIHPFLGPITGKSGEFTIPTTGEHSVNTWFEVKITATDTNGLSSSESVFIYPEVSSFSLNSNIAGLILLLDGVPTQIPQTIAGVVDFMRELNTYLVQQVNGVWYQFDHWSDMEPMKHFITVAEAAVEYVAHFNQMSPFEGQYFDNVDLSGVPVLIREDPVIDFAWNEVAPAPEVPADNFSVRWSKTQHFAFGRYKFTTVTDDGVRLYIDGNLLIDHWIPQGSTAYTATLDLAEGDHEIIMEYFEASGGAVARLIWEMTPDQPIFPSPTPSSVPSPTPGVGFNAEYFSNQTLTAPGTLTRTDPEINFLWNDESPDPSILVDHFSARWTQTVDLVAGTYHFTATADDGIRVFVDGNPIIDEWQDQGSTTFAADATLTAGAHEIVVEYYENSGGAIAVFDYDLIGVTPSPSPSPSVSPTADYTAKFWNTPGEGEFPPIPTTTPDLTRSDSTINFFWDLDSPDPLIDVDHFVVVWEKTHDFPLDSYYRFTTESDDGMNIYIDGVKVLDEWNDHSMEFVFHTYITAGLHEIRVEYYENDGGAKAIVGFEPVATIPPIYSTEFFNNETLFGTPVLTREDEILYFVWAENAPDPLINPDHFSARWTKTDTFAPGIYEFTVFADDAMRLYVDGVLEVDAWTGAAEIYHYKEIELSGEHTITVEYAELEGGAYAKMYYKKIADLPDPSPSPSVEPTPSPSVIPSPSPSPSPSVPPGDDYLSEFWNLPTPVSIPEIPTTAPDLTRIDATILFDWNDDAPDPLINTDGFVARFTKQIDVTEAGTYRFTTLSDDGVRVDVESDLVIDQWNDHGSTTHVGDKFLSTGSHEIVVEFYENAGGAILHFDYALIGGTPPSDFSAEYFSNQDLTAPAALTRSDALINFVWDELSPDPLIPVDHFSARWTKTKFYLDGLYSFTVKSDDGVRFYIDDVLYVDDWTDHAMKIETVLVPMTSGDHVLKLEYYENAGGAVSILEEN